MIIFAASSRGCIVNRRFERNYRNDDAKEAEADGKATAFASLDIVAIREVGRANSDPR